MVHQHRHVHALLDGKARRTGRQIAKAGLVVDIFRAAILLRDGGKILGNGELTKSLTVKAAKFTAGAQEKIEKAGGKAEVI